MEKDRIYYHELIAGYFSGEIDSAAVSELSAWVKQNSENQKQFEDYHKTWLILEETRIETIVDINDEWSALQAKIQFTNVDEPQIIKPDFSPKKGKNIFVSVLRIAAVLVVFAASAFLIYQWLNKPVMQKAYANNVSLEQKLPDGTSVTLNAGASIQYPDKFTGGNRKVTLTGEAYFDVAHDSTKPFVIDAGVVTIQVLGTSFYVNTSDADGNTIIVLTTGKVKITSKTDINNIVILSPGEKAVFSASQNEFVKKQNEDMNYLAWKTGKIRFENATMKEIANTLGNVYRKNIKLTNDEIANCRVTATFENQSLDAVLNVLKATIDIKTSTKGNTIEISGNACDKK